MLEVLGSASRRLPVSRSKVRAGRLISLAAIRLGASAVRVVRLRGGALVEIDLRSRTEAQVFWNGTFEADYLECLKALSDVFEGAAYDIGANVGLIALPLAHHLRGRQPVMAFEPVAENHARLVRSARLNALDRDDLLTFQIALGATNRDARIAREARFGAASGNARIVQAGEDVGVNLMYSDILVRRLDDVVAEHDLPPPKLIKLDVEGNEVDVLRGAAETLRRSRPVILGEFNSQLMPLFGTTFPDAAMLLPEDYRIFSFLAGDLLTEREPAVGLGDVLLVPAERVGALPLRIA